MSNLAGQLTRTGIILHRWPRDPANADGKIRVSFDVDLGPTEGIDDALRQISERTDSGCWLQRHKGEWEIVSELLPADLSVKAGQSGVLRVSPVAEIREAGEHGNKRRHAHVLFEWARE